MKYSFDTIFIMYFLLFILSIILLTNASNDYKENKTEEDITNSLLTTLLTEEHTIVSTKNIRKNTPDMLRNENGDQDITTMFADTISFKNQPKENEGISEERPNQYGLQLDAKGVTLPITYLIFKYLSLKDIAKINQTCKQFRLFQHNRVFGNCMVLNSLQLKYDKKNFAQFDAEWTDLMEIKNIIGLTTDFTRLSFFKLRYNRYAIFQNEHKKSQIIQWEENPFRYLQFEISKKKNTKFDSKEMFVHHTYGSAKLTSEKMVIIENRDCLNTGNTRKHYLCEDKLNIKKIVAFADSFVGLTEIGDVIISSFDPKNQVISFSNQAENIKNIFTNRVGTVLVLLHNNGTVSARGDPTSGGEIPHEINSQLKNVKNIYSATLAFAAILENGNVVAWGNRFWGGQIPPVLEPKLKNVKMIFPAPASFTAWLENGGILSWGWDSSVITVPQKLQDESDNIKEIFVGTTYIGALLYDGTIFAWDTDGIIPNEVETKLKKNVKTIITGTKAFVAILIDGNVIALGNSNCGGEIPHDIQLKLSKKKVKEIITTFNGQGFCALCMDGSVECWPNHSDFTEDIKNELEKDVKMIVFNWHATGAVKEDGTIILWGNPERGGKIPEHLESKLKKNVEMLYADAASGTMTALCKDGNVYSWGKHADFDDSIE